MKEFSWTTENKDNPEGETLRKRLEQNSFLKLQRKDLQNLNRLHKVIKLNDTNTSKSPDREAASVAEESASQDH